MRFDPDEVARALRKSWSVKTAQQWTAENPAAGQCNVTALLVHDTFGGELLKTQLRAGDHFYNRIEHERFDFTASQFEEPITYLDANAHRNEVAKGVTEHELAALLSAFREHY